MLNNEISTDISFNRDSVEQRHHHHLSIFRFKFTEEFTGQLYIFSKIHEHDHRKDFKEAWAIWLEENNDFVEKEVNRLENIGYEGDILDKMFKSARYYFRKKSTEKKEPQQRKDYIGVNRELLNKIDEHIQTVVITEKYKPSNAFETFCDENTELLKNEEQWFHNNGLTNREDIKSKLKKTYKNRYFVCTQKTQINKEKTK
jgi:hypothetical protein